MNTVEILSYLKHICSHRNAAFDVLASDQLLNYKITKYPVCLIVNLDESSKPGSHWTAYYIENGHSRTEFFCSYGVPVHMYPSAFAAFIRKRSKPFLQTNVTLQQTTSKVCGHYCIFYVYMRLLKYSSDEFYASFTTNCKKNDAYVGKTICGLKTKFCISCTTLFNCKNQCCIEYNKHSN